MATIENTLKTILTRSVDAIIFGFVEPLKDKRTLKLVAFLALFIVVMSLVLTAAVFMLFKPYADNPSSMAALTSNMSAAIGFLAYFFVMVIALAIIQSIIVNLIDVMAIFRALEMKSFIPKAQVGIMSALKLIVVNICVTLFAFFSVFNLKMLVILAVSALLLIAGIAVIVLFQANMGLVFVGMTLVLLGAIVFAAYMIVFYYNSLRLMFSPIIFVEKDLGVIDSCKASWTKTEGQVLGLFVATIVLSVLLTILMFAASILAQVYSAVATLINPGISDLALSVDPIYIVLSLPIYVFSAYAVIVGSFFITSLYASLSGKTHTGVVVEKNAPKRPFFSKKK
ncbi:MAG: hypothetical protein AABW59_02550 [archaeon]